MRAPLYIIAFLLAAAAATGCLSRNSAWTNAFADTDPHVPVGTDQQASYPLEDAERMMLSGKTGIEPGIPDTVLFRFLANVLSDLHFVPHYPGQGPFRFGSEALQEIRRLSRDRDPVRPPRLP